LLGGCRINLFFTLPPPVGIAGVPMQYLVDTDESTVYLANSSRGYGYALVGQKAVVAEKFVRGQKMNLLLSISIAGVVSFWVYESNTNGTVRLCVSSQY
jgi:hypothetical protein